MVSDSSHHLSPVMPVLAGVIAVLLLASPVIGEAFAYSAEYSDSVPEKVVPARYILVTGEGFDGNSLTFRVIDNSGSDDSPEICLNGTEVRPSPITHGEDRYYKLDLTRDGFENLSLSYSVGGLTGTLKNTLSGGQ